MVTGLGAHRAPPRPSQGCPHLALGSPPTPAGQGPTRRVYPVQGPGWALGAMLLGSWGLSRQLLRLQSSAPLILYSHLFALTLTILVLHGSVRSYFTHAHARAHTHSCKMASHLTAGARPLPHTHVWGPASESCVASGAPCPLRLAKSHQLGPRAESNVYTARAESTVYTARGSRGAPMPLLSQARCDSDCPAVADEQKLSVLRAGGRPSPS